MSFKLVVLFATLAVVSSTQFESREQETVFDNRDVKGNLQLNEQQRRLQDQDKYEENRQFFSQERFDNERRFQNRFDNERRFQDRFDNERRFQDRFDNDRRHNFNNRGAFDQNEPTYIHLQPAVFNVQSSSRHFNVQDDSNYDVAYSVSDVTTGDIKTHQETRRGDEVQGQYTILDSDGFQRRVNYRANDRDGFDAEVRREPVIGFRFPNNYQGHQNQQNFHSNQQFQHQQFNNNNQQFNNFNKEQFQNQHISVHPKSSVATTSVSKTEDGQHNQYTTTINN